MATPQGTDWGPSLQCRAGVHARREALRRPGRVLARPRCGTPPPSLTRCHLPLQGRLLGRQPIDSLPCKGLRSRAPPAAEKAVSHAANGRHSFYYRLFGDRKHRIALRSPLRSLPLRGNAAVAEHKRASARAVRCGHRKPDGGCAARRRRRGALPPCPTGILQTLAGPCPAFVGDDACIVPETLRCRKAPRRAKSPALHCGREWAATHKHQPSVGPADGPMQASAPTQGGLR